MASNVTIPATGSGTATPVIATEDVSGIQYQKVKLVDGTASSTTVITAGGGVEAGALRVTIANDSTGLVSVDDNSGSLTVDAPVGTPVNVQIGDGSNTASIRNLASNDALNVAIVDGSGTQVTSFGGGTQYTEGDTDTTITGTALMLEGAANTLVAAPGTAADGLLVNLGTNNDVTVASLPLPSGAATAANQSTIIGHVDGLEGLLTTIDGDTGNISTKIDTLAGAVSGTEFQVDVLTMPTVTVASHAVTNAGTFVVQENGAALTALQLIDDAVATLGTTTYSEATTKGLTIGAVRRDADTTLVDTTNEVGPLQMDANGRLKVEVFSGETLPVSGTVAVTQSGTWDEVGIHDSGNSITVDNGGTFAVQDSAAETSLAILDDWDESDRAKVNLIVGQAGVPGGGGTEATALRVTLANDSTGLVSVDDNGGALTVDNGGTFAVQVDGSALTSLQLLDDTVATLGTTTYSEATTKGLIIGAVRRDADTTLVDTTNEVGPVQMNAAGQLKVEVFSGETLPVSGTVAVTQSGTWDEVGIHDSGNSITVDNAQLSVVGSGTEAAALRVTIATDSTGVLSIDDNGGNISIDDGGNTITVDGTVTVNLAAGTNTNEVVGDAAHDAAAAGNPLLMGAYASAAAPSDVSGDGDAVRVWALRNGAQAVQPTFSGTIAAAGNGTAATAQRVTLASDSTGVVTSLNNFVTCSTDITRPSDTTAYAANDALSDSTSAPMAGGFTFSSAARTSGGSGIITDAIITTSNDAGTLLQGELFIFDQAVTNINDNSAFAVSDAEIKTCVAKIPFTLEDVGNNGFFHATNLNMGFTCVGTDDLRFLVRVKNAYTPASAEVLTFVLKILQVT